VDNQLAGNCIEFLGCSERPDLASVLEEIKNRREQGFPTTFSGAIIQAAFYGAVIQKHGFVWSVENLLGDADTSFGQFVKWRESAEGRPWAEWSDSVNRTQR
jgi:hypothetical protein